MLGAVLHFSSVIVLVEKAGLDPVIGSALGFFLALVVSFYLNRNWTFESRAAGPRQFLIYSLVSLNGLLLNSGIMYFSVHVWQWNYLYGQGLAAVVVPISNFILNRIWTFPVANDKNP